MLFPGELKPLVEMLGAVSELLGILKLPGFYTSKHTMMMYKEMSLTFLYYLFRFLKFK